MKRFLIITIFLMAFNSEARLKIEIAKGTEQLQKIAIVPFNSNINSQFEYCLLYTSPSPRDFG